MAVLAPTGLPARAEPPRRAELADRAELAGAAELPDRAELAGRVRRASDLARDLAAGGTDHLPVAPELRPLLPRLRRGSTVAVAPGTSSLVLALLAPASAAGAWAAVVGMPGFGALAAAQAGVVWERLALVPHPGPEWSTVVATLLDGFDIVVAVPPGAVAPRLASRLAARARQRGGVLLSYGPWPGADLALSAGDGVWEGLGAGHGRLRSRELTITARGRGAAGRPRRVRVTLPDGSGRLAPARTGRAGLTLIQGAGPKAAAGRAGRRA